MVPSISFKILPLYIIATIVLLEDSWILGQVPEKAGNKINRHIFDGTRVCDTIFNRKYEMKYSILSHINLLKTSIYLLKFMTLNLLNEGCFLCSFCRSLF